MVYQGKELVEITERQIFNPPKKLLVWDCREGNPENIREALVVAILPAIPYHPNIVCLGIIGRIIGSVTWATHCAEIPEEQKQKRATWEQLAYWLIDGKGLVLDVDTNRVDTGVYFNMNDMHEEVGERYYVMARGESKWNEPTIDYLGIKED